MLSAKGDGTAIFANPLAIDVTRAPYSAKFDRFTSIQGSMSSSSNPTQLTVGDYTFTTADVGKQVQVRGAGAAGGYLETTITSIASGKAVLATSCSTTVAGANVIFGTDDTAALNQCFADAASVARSRPLSRVVMLPQGAALFTQLLLPQGVTVVGAGSNWGNYDIQYAFFGGAENVQGSVLYQMWGQNQDGCRFLNHNATGVWAGRLDGFVVEQDVHNESGKGISFRDVSGNPMWIIDGGKLHDVAVFGFASAGWEMPVGSTPGFFDGIYAFQNGYVDGSAGIVYTCHGGGDDGCFVHVSGCGNSGGLLKLVGQGTAITEASITIGHLHSEMFHNDYRDPAFAGAPQQTVALVLDNMQGASIDIGGMTHHADGETNITFTANTNGTTTLSNVSSFSGIAAGTVLAGANIPPYTTVISTNTGAGTLVMSHAASSTVTGETIGVGIDPAIVVTTSSVAPEVNWRAIWVSTQPSQAGQADVLVDLNAYTTAGAGCIPHQNSMHSGRWSAGGVCLEGHSGGYAAVCPRRNEPVRSTGCVRGVAGRPASGLPAHAPLQQH